MPPPKNLLHFMPLPGQKLKSVVVAEPPPVDQPLIEEDIIPSPLKPSAASGIEIQDITEVMEAIEADFVPGLVVPEVAEEKESADLPFEREKSPDKEMIDLSGPEAAVPEVQKEVPSAGEEEQPEQGLTRKRRHSTLGSTSTSALDRLIHADPCSDVPLKRIPEEVRETMARYARAPILGEDPLAHVGSLKAGQLLSELTELKQLYLRYSREARESAEKIGTEEMKSKFEAADKEHKEAELRLHHFVQHRELIQQQADKVPVLRLKLREKDDYIRKLEQERARAQKATSEGDTTAGGSSKDAPLGAAPETPKS
ncbi:uncharacterized protein [Spinacia oleracea]|uniref:Uncharacterized protein n=1 Tax=Spinacia oleracea TaxID=3562 RepID=A0ABM3RJ22_SPIOL|nr:uncharacterized protein LOC130470062 [Spinacia oleracea]